MGFDSIVVKSSDNGLVGAGFASRESGLRVFKGLMGRK